MSTPYLIQPYFALLHDRPIDKIPIRQLQSNGEEELTTNELLSIALGRVESLTRLTEEYGTHFLTTLRSVKDIVDLLDLDHLTATRLLAILSLGRRLYAPSQGSLITIRGIEDVYHHYRAMENLGKEHLKILLVNSRYQIIYEETLAIGSTDELSLTPSDVFQPVVERRAKAAIFVHNHPSGDPTPSQSDISFTEAMQKAGAILGITLLDHVIIGLNTYASALPNEPSY